MPASRKRKLKPAGHGKPALTAAVVPTRRQRESYAESTPGETCRADLDAANAMMADRSFGARSNDLIAQAYRSLQRSPFCVDAYLALSEEVGDPEQSLDYLRRGIHAGELALDGLDPAAELFWAHSEGKRYFEARIRLADAQLQTQEETAIAELRAVLALDPPDRSGARYVLLGALLNQDEIQPARALLDAYPEDRLTAWMYGRLLVGYREEQRSGAAVVALMAQALASNSYVPGVFAEVVEVDDGDERDPGSPGEAALYDAQYGVHWDDEPGAVEWLIALAASAAGPAQ